MTLQPGRCTLAMRSCAGSRVRVCDCVAHCGCGEASTTQRNRGSLHTSKTYTQLKRTLHSSGAVKSLRAACRLWPAPAAACTRSALAWRAVVPPQRVRKSLLYSVYMHRTRLRTAFVRHRRRTPAARSGASRWHGAPRPGAGERDTRAPRVTLPMVPASGWWQIAECAPDAQ